MQAAVIINPVAGKSMDILRVLNDFFVKNDISWKPYVTQRKGHATKLVAKALTKKPGMILVYGGDGTVMEAAHGLIGTDVPLLVIPGGTANVVAKEFGIPQNVEQALQLVKKGNTVPVDTFSSSDQLGFIRINHGLFANAIITAKREQKEQLGTLAYTVESLKQVFNLEKTTYQITVDNKEIETEGLGASITNLASVGLASLKFHAKVQPHDGLLDLIVIKNLDVDLVSSIRNQTVWSSKADSIEHYQGKRVAIKLPKQENIIVDDNLQTTDLINSFVSNKRLQVVVPRKYEFNHPTKN
jgi:diacylglycerol kinase (ATP)